MTTTTTTTKKKEKKSARYLNTRKLKDHKHHLLGCLVFNKIISQAVKPGLRFRLSSFFFLFRSVTNRRLVSSAHALLVHLFAFSFPEAALLLVSTKNRDLWPGPTAEVCDSRTSRHSAHAQSRLTNLIGSGFNLLCLQSHLKPGQWSRFLVLTKKCAASGDENDAFAEVAVVKS